MRSEWPLVHLGEVTVCFDNQRVPVRAADRKPGPYPYYGASGIVDYVHDYIFDGEYLLVAEDGENLRTRKLPVAFMATGKFWVNNHAHVLQGNGLARTQYLCYALQTCDFGAYLSGSTMPKLTLANMNRILVPLPPISVQDAIIGVLGALDSQIAVLGRMNATLEQMAVAVFTSWFIDFDPVRAKAEGREPEGVDADTAALFPDGFDETGRTAVPRGWRRGVLGDILFDWTERVGSRSVPVLSAVNSGELVPSKEVFRKQVHSTNTSHYKVVPPFAFAYNPSRINIGSIGLNETGQDGAVSPVYVVCRPVSVPVAYYVWHLLRTPAIREWINVLSSGTVRQNLTYRDFASIPVVIPPDELLERFLSIRSTLYRRVAHNQRMIDTLTALRAELLPRLISGKLRVPEAEEALKEVL